MKVSTYGVGESQLRQAKAYPLAVVNQAWDVLADNRRLSAFIPDLRPSGVRYRPDDSVPCELEHHWATTLPT